MTYYDNSLNLLSLVLVLIILFVILFGCRFKKNRNIEGFTSEENEDNKNEKNNDKDDKDDKNDKSGTCKLEKFENMILDGLNNGSINDKDMKTYIENGTFTEKNLENIINYIDNFRNNIGI